MKLYSERNSESVTEFQYSVIPQRLKNQIFHIWNRFFKQVEDVDKMWEFIEQKISEVHGLLTLLEDTFLASYTESFKVKSYFENNENIDECLDIIELVFRYIAVLGEKTGYNYFSYKSNDAISDLNKRFKQNGVGYQFLQSQIVKIDNEYLQKNITEPAFLLLSDFRFKNADEEFKNANFHYRHNRYKECLNECLKAFESTIKIICNIKGWAFEENFTARPLIGVLINNNFLPTYQESQLHAMRQLWEGSILTFRNKNSGHGQGVKSIIVPESLASYMLNTTALTIKFLIDTLNSGK